MSTTSPSLNFISPEVSNEICEYVQNYIADFIQENSCHPGTREAGYVYRKVLNMPSVQKAAEDFRSEHVGVYRIDEETELEISALFKSHIYNIIIHHW